MEKKFQDVDILEWFECDGTDTFTPARARREFKDHFPEHEKTEKENKELFLSLFEAWKNEELQRVGKLYVYKGDYESAIADMSKNLLQNSF